METNNEKVFFLPGDIVTIKLDIPNKPRMLVVKKETSIFKNPYGTNMPKNPDDSILRGIRCRWFADGGILQEDIFNTKDLVKL